MRWPCAVFVTWWRQRNKAARCGNAHRREDHMADRLISCDDHMDLSQLPADLWTSRLPASLLDRAPHIEERDGQAVWVCDGKVWGRWDGKPPVTGSARPVKALYNAFDRAAIYDQSARRPAVPELRLADMDRDGVETQVIFGPPSRSRRTTPSCARPATASKRLVARFLQGGAGSAHRPADASGDARGRRR